MRDICPKAIRQEHVPGILEQRGIIAHVHVNYSSVLERGKRTIADGCGFLGREKCVSLSPSVSIGSVTKLDQP